MSDPALPADGFATEEALDEFMSRPTPALCEQLARGRGDLVLLGVAGKMGVTLGMLAVRALRQAGSARRVVGVARFSDARARRVLEDAGVATVACDLLDADAVQRLPAAEDVIFLAGRKFGTSGAEADLTWAMNAVVPANVVRRYAGSRIVALSTGCVYPMVPAAAAGCDESVEPAPAGEYAMSALARERVFSWASRSGTRVCLIRLNYALDLRYGVIHDIAQQIAAGAPVDRTVPLFNGIWQGDANRMVLQCLELCSAPARTINLTGPETLPVERIAGELGRLLQREVTFAGDPSPRMWLSDAGRALDRFGYPTVTPAAIVRWTARWIADGGRSLGKPTHFQTTDGKF